MILLNIVLGLIGLGLIVFIHELGHFLAAKMNGIAVEVFSLGWGPKLVGFTRGGTTYQIAWFPIGGYCKMKGEIMVKPPEEKSAEDAKKEAGSYPAAHPLRRICVAAFGPLFNLVFALAIFTVIWWAGFRVFSPDNRIILATDYSFVQFDSPPPAAAAGLKTGDRIIAINGERVENWSDIKEWTALSARKTLVYAIQRGAETLEVRMTPVLDKETAAGQIGIYPWYDPVVESVDPEGPAALVGLHKGDRILAVNGVKVEHGMGLYAELARDKLPRVSLEFERPGTAGTLQGTIAPVYGKETFPELGIGWALNEYRTPLMGPGQAFVKSLSEVMKTIRVSIETIGVLFQGVNLQNAVGGTPRIVWELGDAVTSGFSMGVGTGFVTFFRFSAFLCIALFIMNLLPIPITDGGQIVLFLIELIRGKPVQPRTVVRYQYIGFSIILALIVFFTFNDIVYFVRQVMGH